MVLPDEEGENVNEVPRLLKLLNKTGYEIVQNNGQRVFGPPPDWSGSPPRKGSEVFVGKLPRDCYEDELVPFMEKIGKVYETRLMMDFSGSNRGYAFVMYTNPEDASKAVKNLNNVEIRKGRAVGVVKSVDNCRLFIGGLPKNRKREEIFEAMSNLVEGVKSVILYNCVNDKNKSRGFAFVEFDSHRSAAMARRRMLSSKARLWGYEVAVDWAEPEIDVEDSIMSKVTVLYVRNLMMSTTEEKIKEIFKKAGDANVEKVKKIRDFAFVHFSVREAAEKAQNVMNGSSLDGSVLEVTWAKPINKNLYRIHKAMLRSNNEIKSGWPGAFATYSQYPGFLAAWNSSTAYGTENPSLPKRIIRGAGGFRAGRAILQTSNNPPVMMPLIPEAHNKDSCFCLDTANLSVSKEQPECCEEATRHMMYYKVAVPPYPISTANHEDTSRFHLVPSPNSNGFDQTVITAGHVLHRPLLMAPSGSAPNGIHPDVTVTYAVPPPAAYYFHAPNKIPAYETGTYCDGRFCIPEPSSAGVV